MKWKFSTYKTEINFSYAANHGSESVSLLSFLVLFFLRWKTIDLLAMPCVSYENLNNFFYYFTVYQYLLSPGRNLIRGVPSAWDPGWNNVGEACDDQVIWVQICLITVSHQSFWLSQYNLAQGNAGICAFIGTGGLPFSLHAMHSHFFL